MTCCGADGLCTAIYIIVIDILCAANFGNTLKNTRNKTYLNPDDITTINNVLRY